LTSDKKKSEKRVEEPEREYIESAAGAAAILIVRSVLPPLTT